MLLALKTQLLTCEAVLLNKLQELVDKYLPSQGVNLWRFRSKHMIKGLMKLLGLRPMTEKDLPRGRTNLCPHCEEALVTTPGTHENFNMLILVHHCAVCRTGTVVAVPLKGVLRIAEALRALRAEYQVHEEV